MFVRKNDDNFEHFKYKHTEIASFLGYENIENYKYFLNMMKKELRNEIDYITTINNKEITYMISQIGFYILYMIINQILNCIDDSVRIARNQLGFA